MRLLFLFLSFISMMIPKTKALTKNEIEEYQLGFIDQVENKYQYYEIFETIEFDEFSLVIVKGIYNNSGCYGISFVSTNQNEFYLVLETSSSSFELPNDGIGSRAIAIKADISYAVLVYDKNDNKVDMKKITLNKFNESDFDKTTAILGNNASGPFTALVSHKATLKFLPVLLITFSVMIGIVGITILILFLTKKGLFDKEKRKEGVISMRDIYEANTNDLENDGISFDDIEEPNEEDDEGDEKIVYDNTTPSTVIPVINPNKREDDDEIVEKVTDIKKYLQDQGFFTDYKVLSEEEKNKIMMELIKLKNDSMISMDAYYKETYELWKK